ncbi:MAG: LemA family protein [Epsilonproteobacteria bacterium]|nr:LemA family protein [Campylobacterota bacterium]
MKKIFSYILLLIVAFSFSGCIINNVPKYDEEVKAAWAQVLNQYKRRADLIPNLISTVKGYAKHEKEVFKEVVEARAKATSMQLPKDILTNPEAFKKFQQVQGELGSALSRLLAVSERYPDLKANQNFLALQSQLEGTENRIAVARRDYINAVKKYNLELRTIPNKWIAHLLYPDAKMKQTFTISQQDMKVPKVDFN